MARLSTSLLRVAAVPVLVSLAACTGSGEASPTTTTPVIATTEPAVPTTTAPPTDTVSVSSATPNSTTPTSTSPMTSGVPSTADTDAVDWAAIGGDLYRRAIELPKDPSLEAVAALCLAGSPCERDQTATVDFLLGSDARIEGGTEFEIDAVDFQGTLDGVPVDEALDVTLIVRLTATVVDESRVVKADGSVESTIAPDPAIVAGEQYSQAVSLGRASPADVWQLSALGTLA